MSKHLLRAAAAIAVLVGGAMPFLATAAPQSTIRIKTVESAQQPNLAEPMPKQISPGSGDIEAATVVVQPISIEVEPLAITWRVDVSDGTVRQALSRWAMNAGWVDHWELDIDIPLTASATLATTRDFTEAVQKLAEAVALSEAPFRPCFYSNKVVRIVPYNAMCDRTTTRPARR